MKTIIILFLVTVLSIANAAATDLLISRGLYQGSYYSRGLGTYDWDMATSLLNQNSDITPTYVFNLENNAQVMAADAIWINERWTDGRLSAAEMNNLSQFIATGRKVVFIGENDLWRGWNDQFLGLFGVSTDPVSHYWGGPVSPLHPVLLQNTLTAGISELYWGDGAVPLGGIPLFTDGVVSLFGPSENVLAVLDSNIYGGNLSAFAGQEQFAINTFQWIAEIPESPALDLFVAGLILAVFVRRSTPRRVFRQV